MLRVMPRMRVLGYLTVLSGLCSVLLLLQEYRHAPNTGTSELKSSQRVNGGIGKRDLHALEDLGQGARTQTFVAGGSLARWQRSSVWRKLFSGHDDEKHPLQPRYRWSAKHGRPGAAVKIGHRVQVLRERQEALASEGGDGSASGGSDASEGGSGSDEASEEGGSDEASEEGGSDEASEEDEDEDEDEEDEEVCIYLYSLFDTAMHVRIIFGVAVGAQHKQIFRYNTSPPHTFLHTCVCVHVLLSKRRRQRA
jgi:hypothetical protein